MSDGYSITLARSATIGELAVKHEATVRCYDGSANYDIWHRRCKESLYDLVNSEEELAVIAPGDDA